jgi:hypothetical protein
LELFNGASEALIVQQLFQTTSSHFDDMIHNTPAQFRRGSLRITDYAHICDPFIVGCPRPSHTVLQTHLANGLTCGRVLQLGRK